MFGNLNELPSPVGKFTVGITQVDTRFTTKEGQEKVVPALIYYPADSNCGQASAPYSSPQELQTLNKNLLYLTRRMANLKTHCYSDIPLSTKQENYPVLFYSPGAGMYMMQATVLCCDLASKGYVVVAVGHPSYLGDLRLANGRFINEYAPFGKFLSSTPKLIFNLARKYKLLKKNRRLSDEEFEALTQTLYVEGFAGSYINRCSMMASENLSQILNKLEEINAGKIESQFNGKLRLSIGVGATGHSLGGAIAAQFCKDDERVTCGINMDGVIFGEDPFMDVGKPFMLLGTKLVWNLARQLYTNNSADSYFIEVADTAHFGYSDLLFGARQLNLLGLLGKREMGEFRSIVTDFHLKFFNKYMLKNDDSFKAHHFKNIVLREK